MQEEEAQQQQQQQGASAISIPTATSSRKPSFELQRSGPRSVGASSSYGSPPLSYFQVFDANKGGGDVCGTVHARARMDANKGDACG